MNSDDLNVGQLVDNEFVEMTAQCLRLDHGNPIKTTPLTTENQENNPNQLNNVTSTKGQQYNGSAGSTKTSITAGRSSSSSTSSNGNQVCRAYAVAEFYRQRKEFQLKKIKEAEQQARKYIAKPMPNFRAIHSKALTVAKETHEACVSPETPEVLRRGLAMKEKQKQKIKEHELKLAERPPIVARSSKVLQEEPFKPKLAPHQQLKVEPFQLKMSQRLKERREFDENYQRELARKKEEEDVQKRLEDERNRKVVRKKTTFKANPNPFKKAAN